MDTSTMRYPVERYPFNDSHECNDLMKVQYKDPNTLMAGTRSGKVLLCDVRESPASSASASTSTARLQHSSAIAHLAALPDGTGILVGGLTTTSIYDLRYTPRPSLKGHLPRTNTYRHSPATLNFTIPETRRQNRYGLGWAYDPELNLMIAASTDHVKNHRVSIWSCTTGRMVPSPLGDHVFSQPVICADIARLRDGPKSILLSNEDAITEWTALDVGRGKSG
jgi:hypothetical protein